MDCSSWSEVKQLITCATCDNIFENPHTLFCCHTFCELCIKQNDIKKCPSCPEDFAGNELIRFKAICFENRYLSRLAIIFKEKENILKTTNLKCKTDTYVLCSNCYFIGLKDCKFSTEKSICQVHNFCQVDLSKPPEHLLQHTVKQTCATHPNDEVTKYCYTCKKEHCDKCFTKNEIHLSDTVQCIKEKLLKRLATLEENSDIQQKLQQQVSDLQQHRDILYKLYEEEYASTEQSYDHKIYRLCQEKQIVLSKLMTFWSITERAVDNYSMEIHGLQKFRSEFYAYFALLIEKSSDRDIIAYFTKEKRQYVIHKVVEMLKEGIRIIQKERRSFLQEKHILDKLKEQTILVKSSYFVCTDLSETTHSRAGKTFKQEYQCLNYKDKLFKIDQIQIDILGEKHSMFTLPLPSSKLVHTAKQEFVVISKCAQCLSQLQLFSRALGKKYPELGQIEIVKSLNNHLLCSNTELLSVTTDAITGIKTAMTHLQEKNVLSYCQKLEDNLDKLEIFIKKSKEYYSELEVFYHDQQKLHISHDQAAVGRSGVVYISMLLDIMMDCRRYISNTTQICEKLSSIQKMIEILKNEGHEKKPCQATHMKNIGDVTSSDHLKKLIASSGFQLQIVMHYSTWVALNEVCKTTAELITCWDLEKALCT